MPKRCEENKHQFVKFVPAYVEAPLNADLRTKADFRKKSVKIVRMDESRMKIICRKCGYNWMNEK